MSKRKILYSDLPRPYDDDAARLTTIIGIIFIVAMCAASLLLFFGMH